MQVFHPFEDAYKSAQCIDDKRLLNQVNEIKTILGSLREEYKAWRNHSTTKLWENNSDYLRYYQIVLLDVWTKKHYCVGLDIPYDVVANSIMKGRPKFFTLEYFKEQQKILLKKNPEHYKKYFPDVEI